MFLLYIPSTSNCLNFSGIGLFSEMVLNTSRYILDRQYLKLHPYPDMEFFLQRFPKVGSQSCKLHIYYHICGMEPSPIVQEHNNKLVLISVFDILRSSDEH